MNYYVISPNVSGDGNNQEVFLREMFQKHIVLMGWGTDDQFGKTFKDMVEGDVIIVAQGANRQKRQFFIGEISSKSAPFNSSLGRIEQSRQL